MPDMSHIDSEKILSAVSQLESIVARMSGQVGKFSDAIGTLDKGWVSEVKSEFMASYQTDLEAMHEMLQQLTEINTGLREAASDFDKTENEVLACVHALG